MHTQHHPTPDTYTRARDNSGADARIAAGRTYSGMAHGTDWGVTLLAGEGVYMNIFSVAKHVYCNMKFFTLRFEI